MGSLSRSTQVLFLSFWAIAVVAMLPRVLPAQDPPPTTPPAPNVAALRRSLRHGELVAALTAQVEAADKKTRPKLAAQLARIRLEADLLRKVAPLDQLPKVRPQTVLGHLAQRKNSGVEELTLARLAFLLDETSLAEAALGRARDVDPTLRRETDEILARARKRKVPRGGFHRYRGEWLPKRDRDICDALDRALEALAAVRAPGIEPPVRPNPTRANRPRFLALGKGAGEAQLRAACRKITATLGEDYATVRGWLKSYAARPALREKLLEQRAALRVVQNQAVALIRRYTKLEQAKVDEYRERLEDLAARFDQLVARDFATLRRLQPATAFALHERLRRREGALTAIDAYFATAGARRPAATPVRPEDGSTVTTAHVLPGRRMSGLEDTLWLLVKHQAGQMLDASDRSAELLRQAKKLTPWEKLILEIILADAVDAYNARAAVSLDAEEWRFVGILNRYRRILGLRPYEVEERLNVASRKHSQEMVDLGYFGHISPVPRNRSPGDRARLEGFGGGVGENCFAGSPDARGAFEGWYHSPGHHRGMISGSPQLGVGRAEQTMWTMVMGGTDWTWRRLHRDGPPGRFPAQTRLVEEFARLVNAIGKPTPKARERTNRLREELAAGIPGILPEIARLGFPCLRDPRHPVHGAGPELLRMIIDAEIGTPWRPLQIAAVAAAIDALRDSKRKSVRIACWELIKPHLQRPFAYDPDASTAQQLPVVNELRKHWEDLAQWRFHAAADAVAPAPRRIAGRDGRGPSLEEARRMIDRKERLRAARKLGGGSRTERAVEEGLAFLASIQDDDGAWRARSFPLKLPKVDARAAGAGNAEWEIAMTGLSLLAFTSAGYSTREGKFAETVARGARFLAGQVVDYGKFDTPAGHYMYNHALGTQALCEVYASSADPVLGAAAQLAVDYLIYAQHAGTGGWRYNANQAGDTSVTGWCIMALNSAYKAELNVSGFRSAKRFLDRVTQSPYYQVGYMSPTDAGASGKRLSAVAMTGRLFLGAERNDPKLVLPAYRMLEELPAAHRIDFYYWYYATLALFQLGDPFWKPWNKALVQVLLDQQDTKSRAGLRGSWPPRGQWSNHGGRIYQTALAVLMLTSYYRYDRSPKTRLYPYSGDIATAIQPLLAAIRDPADSYSQRIAMRTVVDKFGASMIGPVVKLIKNPKVDLAYRRRLASMLHEVAEPRHAGILTELMGQGDAAIANAAMHAFVTTASPRSTAALIQNLGNRHRTVRAVCAQNLGRLGDSSAVAAIQARLKVERDRWVKGELSKALNALSRRTRLRELVGRAIAGDAAGFLAVLDGLEPLQREGLIEVTMGLETREPKLFQEAVEEIRKHRQAAAVPVLLVLMEAEALDVRTRACKLVRSVTGRNFRFDPKANARGRRTAIANWRRWWQKASAGFGGKAATR